MMTQGTLTQGAESGAADGARAGGDAPVALAMSFDDLLGGDDAPGETADDLVRAVREWRDVPTQGGLG